MKNLELEAQERAEKGKKNKTLRNKGLIPAIIYGHGIESFPIAVQEKSFLSAIGTSAGTNAIINLKIGKKTYAVITHDMQHVPLSNKISHIDFLNVRMDEAIKAKVHIELSGIPLGVKDEGGILVLALREIEIKCLPNKIPEKIIVDVSNLKTGEGVQVSDLKSKYKDIEFLSHANELIAQVTAPTKEEEVAPAVAPEGEVAAAPVEGQPAAEGAPAKAPAAAPKQEAKK